MTWFLMQSIEHAHLHAWIEPMRNAGRDHISRLGQPTDSLLAFNATVCELHFNLDQWTKRGALLLHGVINNPDWFREVVCESALEIFKLNKTVNTIASSNYQNASSEALAGMVRDFFSALKSCHLAGLSIVILETRHELWTNYVRGLVARAIEREGSPSDELASIFSILTTPDRPSMRVREKLARGKIYERVRADSHLAGMITANPPIELDVIAHQYPVIHDALVKHHQRFWWLPYMYQGPGWEVDHFLRELATMIESDIDPQKFRRLILKSFTDRKALEDSLNFSAEDRRVLSLTRQLMYLKDARKEATYFAFANTEHFWHAVSSRIGRPLHLTRMLLPEEVTSALEGRSDVPDESSLVNRLDGSCVEYINGNEQLLVGKPAATALSKVIRVEEGFVGSGAVFKGTCAVPGNAKGIVKIVNSPEEGQDMKDGQILVSVATDPSLEPAMSRAAAIVTDMGGITCHAAIVSRELGTPCVVGTRFASKVLIDGDLVEVDATKGLVRRITS